MESEETQSEFSHVTLSHKSTPGTQAVYQSLGEDSVSDGSQMSSEYISSFQMQKNEEEDIELKETLLIYSKSTQDAW